MADALREIGQEIKVSRNQDLLLHPPPTLDLALSGNRIAYIGEFLVENEFDRASHRCEAVELSSIVLSNAQIKGSARGSAVVAAITATYDVQIRGHVSVR